MPDSNAFMPRYGALHALGTGADKFDDSTATLLLTVRAPSPPCTPAAGWTQPPVAAPCQAA
jgi:hypothetical protein